MRLKWNGYFVSKELVEFTYVNVVNCIDLVGFHRTIMHCRWQTIANCSSRKLTLWIGTQLAMMRTPKET